MATSHDSGQRGSENEFLFFRDGLPSLTRYDVVMALIPLAFLTMFVVKLALGVPLRLAVTGGSLVSAVVVADALFFHPPISPDEPEP